jgi:dihydrolipoamide dehydrogenase
MLARSLQKNALISQSARFAFSTGPQYDVAVIGGGPGGYVAAIKAA